MTPRITTWLIHRRDAAADHWLLTLNDNPQREHRARRRLMRWDHALDRWTNHGRRRV